MPAPDYDELTEALRATDIDLSAAEFHGVITGAACIPNPPALRPILLGQVRDALAPSGERLVELAQALHDEARQRLEATDFEFEPLLGEAELPEQVERLGDWARGFVFGLAAGGLRDAGQLRGDAGEFLLDAMKIGEAEMDDDADIERQEQEIAELVEYLRVGVQLVYEDLRGREGAAG